MFTSVKKERDEIFVDVFYTSVQQTVSKTSYHTASI